MNIKQYHKIYIIGIGGIGVSGLAKILLELGKEVSGSDLVSSEVTDRLISLGAKIIIGPHQSKNISPDTDLVVFTNAIKSSNPELKKAQQLKIFSINYAQCLAMVMEHYISLVVSGTHGKSTTTSMLAAIFIEAGMDPTVVVGTKIKECDNDNSRLGLGRYFIIEGDEYKEAFLNYRPVGQIITNIEADHLDYYKNEQNIIKAFLKVILKIPKGGFLVANADDKNIQKIIHQAKCRVITFGMKNGDYQITHVIQHGELTRFAIKGAERFDLAIRVPGLHNVFNACAAAVLSLSFGIRHEIIQKALLNYSGAWRRFQVKGEIKGVTVIDDYAHHPSEIKATLKAARQFFPGKRIWCIFQPHSGDRTKQLFSDFATSFVDCDRLIITEIYRVAGRENDAKISSKKLADRIKTAKPDTEFEPDFLKIPTKIIRKLKPNDLVITMGAGTITEISDQLLKKLQNKKQ